MGFSALLLFINKYPLTMEGGAHRQEGRKKEFPWKESGYRLRRLGAQNCIFS